MAASSLIIRFTDQSQSFCNGVEFGRILAKMEKGEDNVTNNGFPIREDNINVVKQACKQYGYYVTCSSPYLDGYVNVFIIKNTHNNN